MGAFTDLMGNSPRVAILEAFAENPDDVLSAPEIELITGISRRAVYYSLKKFVEDGILEILQTERKGNFYRLNENDLRAQLLPTIEHILVAGSLESDIKRDFGIKQTDIWESSLLIQYSIDQTIQGVRSAITTNINEHSGTLSSFGVSYACSSTAGANASMSRTTQPTPSEFVTNEYGLNIKACKFGFEGAAANE